MFDRVQLKYAAKQRIRSAQTSPTLVTLVYLLVCYILSTLSSLLMLRTAPLQTAIQDVESLSDLTSISVHYSPLISLLVFAIGYLISIWGIGYQSYALTLSRSDTADYRQLTDGLRSIGVFFLAILLTNIFTSLWAMLLVIPGIIASYRYRLTYYILLDNPYFSALDAIRASKEMMRGNKWNLFVLDLSFIPWHLLCSLTFGILYCWKLPYIETTYANFYQAVSASMPADNSQT